MAGSTAIDLSPNQKMGVIGRELGSMTGGLQSSQRYSDYLGGQMNDMYNNALQASQIGQQNLADKYNRTLSLYQMAQAEAEAEKNRQLQKSLSGGGGGGWNPNLEDYYGEQSSRQAPTKGEVLSSIQNIANNIAGQRGQGAGSYAYGGYNYGGIDNAFNTLMSNARELNYNLNPEWLWQQLGNTSSQYMTPNPIL